MVPARWRDDAAFVARAGRQVPLSGGSWVCLAGAVLDGLVSVDDLPGVGLAHGQNSHAHPFSAATSRGELAVIGGDGVFPAGAALPPSVSTSVDGSVDGHIVWYAL
ncbi:hypothetical protein [Rhodococcus sp. BH5]|uniref:hypothetical protein n=1 Tax=Rhodococcus sp. BH5 TaxID=2871702 RepID=UPI0022CDA263|nr:hypothetical protein [Rhodococcus sp. BH5]MCZ9635137.1 hypothetical protein [Rhodococcus sp. BH5]